MGFIDSIKNFFTVKKIVHVTPNPDSLKDSHIVKAVSYENSELKGDNAKLKNELAKLKQRDKDKNEEDNVKAVLNEKKDELILKSQGKILSFRQFYAKLFRNKKFREQLGIYSFDRSTRLAKFGDFGFTADGDFALLDDQGNLILRMSSPTDMFQSVGALANDMARGMVPVNLDKEGGYIENIMIYDAPELIQTGDKLRFAKARKRPVYEIIQGLNNQIGDISSELAESEAINIELQEKIDKLTSEVKVNEDLSETERAEKSQMEQRVLGINQSFRMIQRNMANLQNINTIQEENISKLETELTDMRKKAEREGVKLSDEKALELIQNIRSTVVNEQPDIQSVVKISEPLKDK